MNVRQVSEIDKAFKRAELRAEWARRAQEDPVAFIEFITRTEKVNNKTGKQERIKLADMQVEMIEFCLKHRRGVIVASPRIGKSHIITIGLTLWLAGKDPAFRCAIGSLKQDMAMFFTSAIMQHVETNEDLHLVFPHMKPAEGKWSKEKLYLDRGDARVVHPTWRALGALTGQQGTRVIVNVLDDTQSQESTATEAESDKVLRWTYAGESRMDRFSGDIDLASFNYGNRKYDDFGYEDDDKDESDFGESMGPRGGDTNKRAGYRWVVANPLQPYDLAHKLVSDDNWALHEAAVVDSQNRTRLPAVYPQSDIDCYSKVSFDRDLKLRLRTPGTQLFREELLLAAKRMGRGLRLRHRLEPELVQKIRDTGGMIVCGVDLATRKNKKSDHTVFFVKLVASRAFFRKLLLSEFYSDMDSLLPQQALMSMPLWIERRKMHSPEIRQMVYDINDRFHPTFVVESNAAQDYIRQDILVERRDIRIFPFHTGPLKNDPEQGVAGALVNDLDAGLTIIPSTAMDTSPDALICEPEVERWVAEMREFVHGAHTGDTLMADWFTREWCFSNPQFMHQIDVAGAPIDDDELRAAGFTDAEIRFTRPNNPEFDAMAAEAEAEHAESQKTTPNPIVTDATKEAAKKAAEAERRMMGDLIRRQVGEQAFVGIDAEDPEIAEIIAARF